MPDLSLPVTGTTRIDVLSCAALLLHGGCKRWSWGHTSSWCSGGFRSSEVLWINGQTNRIFFFIFLLMRCCHCCSYCHTGDQVGFKQTGKFLLLDSFLCALASCCNPNCILSPLRCVIGWVDLWGRMDESSGSRWRPHYLAACVGQLQLLFGTSGNRCARVQTSCVFIFFHSSFWWCSSLYRCVPLFSVAVKKLGGHACAENMGSSAVTFCQQSA